jgi:hypothetical protein
VFSVRYNIFSQLLFFYAYMGGGRWGVVKEWQRLVGKHQYMNGMLDDGVAMIFA